MHIHAHVCASVDDMCNDMHYHSIPTPYTSSLPLLSPQVVYSACKKEQCQHLIVIIIPKSNPCLMTVSVWCLAEVVCLPITNNDGCRTMLWHIATCMIKCIDYFVQLLWSLPKILMWSLLCLTWACHLSFMFQSRWLSRAAGIRLALGSMCFGK